MMAETDIRPFQAVGEVAQRVVHDIAITLPWERSLAEAGMDARARGATISIVRFGLLVRKDGRSELVRFEQIEHGVLLRALNRVAPLPHEIYE